jgi:SAM-dependent methyltransferase/acyl carrier protein
MMSSTQKPAGGQGAPVVRSVAQDVEAQVASYRFRKKDDPRRAERELGKFALKWVLATLQGLGVMREPGEAYELGSLKRRLGVAPKYDRYFAALMRRLEAEGLLTSDAHAMETTARVRGFALEAVEAEVAAFKESFVQRYPACAGLLGFMSCCLSRFEEILTGRTDAADIVFQDGKMDVFAEVFRGDVVSDYFNRVAADAVRGTAVRLRERDGGARRVRVLEIGAGTGGTTAAILEAIEPLADAVEFCFSDLSPAFIRYAKRRFSAQYPGVDYRTLNIEEDPAGQGFAPHSFDVVVAANVLHDTRDIEVTLKQVRKLLKPGGLLVLNEFTAVKDCLFFSGALLHGYWLFEDPDRRLPDSCLLSVPQWASALEQAGFAVAQSFALPTQSPAAECSQSVLLCESSWVEEGAAESAGKSEVIGQWIEQDIHSILGAERSSAYSARRPLMEMGLDSIELVELKSLMGQRFGVKLPPAFLFEHSTQEKMAAALAATVSDEQLREIAPPAPVAQGAAKEIPGWPAGSPAARCRPRPSGASWSAARTGSSRCRRTAGSGRPSSTWMESTRGSTGAASWTGSTSSTRRSSAPRSKRRS